MSVKWSNRVWETKGLPRHSKLLLLALADTANDDGACWPSVNFLAGKTEASESTIRRRLRDLEAFGLLRTESRYGTSNWYVLTVPDPSQVDRGTSQNDRPVNLTPQSPTDRGPQSPTDCPPQSPTDRVTITEPSKNRHRAGRAPRSTTLPPTWTPNGAHRERAVKSGQDIEELVPAFKDHHRAKGSRFADWDSAFNTWLRNDIKFNGLRVVSGSDYNPWGKP